MACYLITGGAGFFGSILKKYFLNKGHKCVSIDLEIDNFKNENFVAYKGDINDNDLMDEIFENHKFDAIFHCAALLAHVKKDLKKLWQANVNGTENVCKYATKHNIKKIIFISSNCLWAKNFDNEVTEDEIEIDVNCVNSLNACDPIVVIPDIVIDFINVLLLYHGGFVSTKLSITPFPSIVN